MVRMSLPVSLVLVVSTTVSPSVFVSAKIKGVDK